MTDGEWFAQLYQESYRSLVLTAYALLRDMGEAEDVTQEAFAVAYGRRRGSRGRTARRPGCARSWSTSPGDGGGGGRCWTASCAGNRTSPRRPRSASTSTCTRRSARLGHEHQAAVVLHYLADLPVDDVASILDVPVGTVKSRLARARAALAVQLRTEEVQDA